MKRFVLSLALFIPLLVQAQAHHELGLTAGVSSYIGDLQDKVFPNYGTKPMGGIVYKYFFNPRFGARFSLMYGSITAADSLSEVAVKRERNLSFASNITEVAGGLELNLMRLEKDEWKFTPYIFGGIAIFHYNPYTRGMNNEKVYLRELGTEGQNIPGYPDRKEYKLTNVSFPIGGGLKVFIGKAFFVTTEIGFRYTNTDYLDDVSKSYVNLDTLKAYRGAQSVALSYRTDELKTWDGNYPNYKYQRGDSKANDWYWYGGLTVTVYLKAFGNLFSYEQAKCPAFIYK